MAYMKSILKISFHHYELTIKFKTHVDLAKKVHFASTLLHFSLTNTVERQMLETF